MTPISPIRFNAIAGFRPEDPNEVAIFKTVLRKTARAVLEVQ
jgi:hypothetical protein